MKRNGYQDLDEQNLMQDVQKGLSFHPPNPLHAKTGLSRAQPQLAKEGRRTLAVR
jgi:hypothetical protein